MKREQIAEILNTMNEERLGLSVVVEEDLSNIVDKGREIGGLDDRDFEQFMKKLVDQIGRWVFDSKIYKGKAPSILIDSWEYGSIMYKLRAKMPEHSENESWSLRAGETYNQDLFTPPEVMTKIWNSGTTFEIAISLARRQVESAFQNASQVNALFTMINDAIANKFTLDNESLIMATINNFTAQVFLNEAPNGTYSGRTGNKAVNLWYLYSTVVNPSTTLTKSTCLRDKDFLKFCSETISNYANYLTTYNALFNIAGEPGFSPSENLKLIMLNDVYEKVKYYLYADVRHNELVTLPPAETVVFWQGNGTAFDFDDISSINVLTDGDGEKVNVTADGLLAVMFDKEALGVTNYNARVTSHVNDKAEFINYWHKRDASFFNDFMENFVVFYIA